MNFLYILNKSLHCDLRKQISSFLNARNVFVCCKRDLSDAIVDIKPIVYRPIGVSRSRIFNRKFYSTYEKSVFDVDTNVKKDVLLFKNNTYTFEVLNYLIPVQLIIWLILANQFRKAVNFLPPESLTVFRVIDLNEKRWRYGVPFAFIFTGAVIAIGAFAYARKCVSRIILHKGGKSVYIETFGILNTGKKDVVPLDKLDCRLGRIRAKGYLPLKNLNKRTNFIADYIVDIKGDFPDPILFDMTAGIQRA